MTSTYDEVPYTSYPFPQSNPLLLHTIARMFGLDAPPPQTARVLEIGCAAGANIMSIASCYPNSHCVGFDNSLIQIEAGLKTMKAAGVKNLELRHLSIMDITKEFGTFDYIIAHGVLSWIPLEVQDKILEICKTNLSQNGVAYISYNTLPGWNSARIIRDMMLYHTSQYNNPTQKVQQARWFLEFINDSTKNSQTMLSQALQREMNLISGQPDFYLLHEHLEANNHAFYFHEFMAKARINELQYLGDVSLETMFSGNLPEATTTFLNATNDIVRTEQYMDFINDRRFRQTLLCHNERMLDWNVPPQIIEEGCLVSRFSYPDGFETHDITRMQRLTFGTSHELTLTTDDVLILAMLKVFFEAKREPVTLEFLARKVREKLRQVNYVLRDDGPFEMERKLSMLCLRYVFLGGLGFYAGTFPCVYNVSKKPMTSVMSRYMAVADEWVCNQRLECTFLNTFDKILLRYLDGTRDLSALVACIMPHFETKELIMNDDKNQPMTNMAEIRIQIPIVIEQRLRNLAECSLLLK